MIDPIMVSSSRPVCANSSEIFFSNKEPATLFVFSSITLSNIVQSIGLPGIMLVPVSSSQAVVGAIVGIGLLKGGRGIQFEVLGKISLGWIATPIIAGVTTFVSLFFMNNVFKMVVVQNENNVISNKINSVITVPKIETTYNSVNLYQPLLFSVIAILLIVVVIMFITIRRKSSQTKEEASSDRLLKYESECINHIFIFLAIFFNIEFTSYLVIN